MNDTTIVNEIHVENPEMVAVKNLAVANIQKLKEIRDQRKAAREMLTDALTNNPEYRAAKSAYDEAQRKHKEAKARAMENPQVYQANDKIKSLTKEYNEVKTAIGDYLVTYADKSGQLSFLTPEGDEVQIARTAKPVIIKTDKKERA